MEAGQKTPGAPISVEKQSSGNDIQSILLIGGAGKTCELARGDLAALGYRVTFTDKAKEGLGFAAGGGIDIILLDDEIAEMDFLDFVNILKGAESTKNIPVGIITSRADNKLRKKGFEAGVAGFLTMPLNGQKLTGLVEGVPETSGIEQVEKDRIMAVEDSPILCKIYAQILSKYGFVYQIVSDPTKAVDVAAKFRPHLILMDQNMPEINGFELTRIFKASREFKNIPIIMVTSDSKKKSTIKALEYGAVDFLTKPFDEEVLLARMEAHLNNKKLYDKLSAAYGEMEILKNRLELLSITDGLTDLFNHRHFHEILKEKMELAQKNQSPLSMILFDIDHFKKFNDTYGHKAGDKVIEVIAKVCNSSIRDGDIAARYGGEEYTVVLPGADKETAGEIAEKIRRNIEKTRVEIENHSLSVTVSVGVAKWDKKCNEDSFVDGADRAMYQSKTEGRNRVTVA